MSISHIPNDNPERGIAPVMDRNLALELVRVTEAAALASSLWVGRGDKEAADQAAVDAMRGALNSLAIEGRVVIGEGEMDEAPMLYIGEQVGDGQGGPQVDVALDPLEGTATTAKGGANALTVVALAEKGGFLNAPDVYMEKLAVGPGYPAGLLDLGMPPGEMLLKLAKAKGAAPDEMQVCILDRSRHNNLIEDIRGVGARIKLIPDGDVNAVIAACEPDSGIDVYMGIGGSPEGVLAAAALQCLGGQMLGRLVIEDDEEKERAERWNITDFNHVYDITEMAHGDIMFAATGVTDGPMLRGVRRFPGGGKTHSVVMRSKSGTVRHIEARHNLRQKQTPPPWAV